MSSPSASARLQALLDAEVGPERSSHRSGAARSSSPRGPTPYATPVVDHELWIKTADVSDLGPLPIKTTPWAHQVRAYHWALPKRAAYLDFGMGAGKSAITVALHVGRKHKRTLILCPKSVVSGWPNQFRRHGIGTIPTVRALDNGAVAHRVKLAQQGIDLAHANGNSSVIVTNYESMMSLAMRTFVKKAKFDFIVFDEAHKIKSHDGRISKLIYELLRNNESHKLMLSGTPLPHSPLDAFGQMRALDDRIFGTTWTRFRLRYSIPDPVYTGVVSRFVEHPWINEDEFAAKLAPLFFHVGREVLDLPPALHIVREVHLGPKARKLYSEIEKECFAAFENGEVTASNALTKLIRLRQITSGFVKTDEGDLVDVDTAKREMLAEILDELP